MQCTSCGKQCDETKAFCPHCGAAVQSGYSQQPTQEQSMYSQQAAQNQSRYSQQAAQNQSMYSQQSAQEQAGNSQQTAQDQSRYSQQAAQNQSMYSQQSAQEQAGNSQQAAQEQQSNSQYSQSQYGQSQYGQSTSPYGQSRYGQSTYGQNASPYGQSQYGQSTSPYGQSQYGQNTSPYGQSRYGQNTSPYGHSPYQQGRPAYMNNNPTVTSQRSHSKPGPGYASGYPMAWFKFLIYFMLFANAAINIFTAVTYLTGSVYLGEDMTMSDVEALYMFYPTAKMIDVVYGVLLIALAAYAIFTRFQLSGFKRRGPFLFILMYVLNLVIGLLYSISIMFTLGAGPLDYISLAPSIITSVVMIFVNVVYFRKREELFVY
ncbi:hypothetical protein ACTQ3M_01940 [Oscillospiraceae bacterium LCP25S3_E10]|nr:hypothetical protein [Ruminococcus sp.]MDD6447347.1 hypothetical protein [Ruminococcus sp.]MDY2857163.1 hypothetical protein [Oscillospiraceae bacterium]